MKPIEVFMRCVENDVENEYDGGKVMLQTVAGQHADVRSEVLEGRFVMMCANDPFMREFPITREEKRESFYRLTIEKVPFESVPPDPNAPAELFNARGEQIDVRGNVILGGKRLPLPAGFDRKTGEPA